MNFLDDTLSFVERWIRDTPGPVLDVGAGRGDLVAALAGRGYDVRGLDPDPESVREAVAAGRRVERRSWPAPIEQEYGAVLFVRSLHHVPDPTEAVSAARGALRGGGLIVVEDFAFTDLPRDVLPWLMPWIEAARAAGLLLEECHPVVEHLLVDPGKPLPASGHHVHSAARMAEALRARFTLLEEAGAPYLYRYLAASVGESEEARDLIARAAAAERGAVESGELWALGRRWVGRAG